MKNATLLDYRMPTSLDVPLLDCEIIEVPAAEGAGPYGVRGAGEMALCYRPWLSATPSPAPRGSGLRSSR